MLQEPIFLLYNHHLQKQVFLDLMGSKINNSLVINVFSCQWQWRLLCHATVKKRAQVLAFRSLVMTQLKTLSLCTLTMESLSFLGQGKDCADLSSARSTQNRKVLKSIMFFNIWTECNEILWSFKDFAPRRGPGTIPSP